ncbi:MAG: tRNA (N6-threonylcarbamoyladenosine(37)-N6)-methyltransferase TrmO [Clostridia bacterium]|nr:tRNA (N6-threonylcarbamoyladenosine(37)-N6)-methyltransferase TrmO [Clostridia bacterium]
MAETVPMKIIAHIHTQFPEKFGIPRQSGLVDSLEATIVFEPEYRDPEAFRGIEGYTHLWLLWQFSKAVREDWSPTVRPPRLGGNTRMGVFASRSPYRPNAIGLSSVRLTGVELHTPQGPVLHVAGADLLDGTPIFDVKPYLAYTDSHPEAAGGFALQTKEDVLAVEFPAEWQSLVPAEELEALTRVLAQDPRPAYQSDPRRVYKMAFGAIEVHFTVQEDILTVCRVVPGK